MISIVFSKGDLDDDKKAKRGEEKCRKQEEKIIPAHETSKNIILVVWIGNAREINNHYTRLRKAGMNSVQHK